MRPNRSLSVLKFLIMASLLIVLVHVALKYISVAIYNEQHGFLFELSNRFDLNDENSVPQWVTQALFLASGVSAFLAAYMSDRRPVARLWTFIGVLGVILSIDDVATLHEYALQSLHNAFFVDMPPTLVRNSWLVLLPFIVSGVAVLLVWAVRLLPRRTAACMALGSIVFIIGAVVIDSLANTVPERSFTGQGLLGGIEGGLQLVGTAIFFYAIVDYLERHHALAIKKALAALKA